MIEPANKEIPVARQCDLVGIARSTYYEFRNCTLDDEAVVVEKDSELVKIVVEIFTDLPFYGNGRWFSKYCIGME